MLDKSLKIAIISDLHCHPEFEKSGDNNTILFSAKLRSPINEHPVENLLEIIDKEHLRVDVVLSPGDITHQCNQQGFFSGWSYVKELTSALGTTDLFATLGNHDVDSRLNHSTYSFDIPRKVKQNYPLPDALMGSFWDKGFVFIERDEFQLLILNSTHYHTHYSKDPVDNPAVRGKVDPSQIEEIEKYLAKNDDPNKIKLFLCHHHPINHARLKLGDEDFIANGEDLLHLLGKYKFDLVVHGHKHDPLLRYFPTDSGVQLPVLSSGSFSATNQILYASLFNYFHIIEIKKQAGSSVGTIETYTFKNKVGWRKDRDDGFLAYTGFGHHGDLTEITAKITPLLHEKQVVAWEKVLEVAPEINNLTPDKLEQLENLFKDFKMNVGGKIGLRPKHIYHERD